MAKWKHNQTLQRQGGQREMLQWKRNNTSQQCGQTIRTNGQQQSHDNSPNDRRTGRRGPTTVDHLLAFKEAVNSARKKKGPVYATFLDVTKAYDKAWIDAILYVMYKRGITSKLWKTIKKTEWKPHSNHQHKARANKKNRNQRQHPTRRCAISTTICAPHRWISKEVQEKDLGIEIPDTTTKIACLLWMDDVLLLETRPKEKQELMDTTDKIAEKYHIKFGKEKSLSLTIGKI